MLMCKCHMCTVVRIFPLTGMEQTLCTSDDGSRVYLLTKDLAGQWLVRWVLPGCSYQWSDYIYSGLNLGLEKKGSIYDSFPAWKVVS